MTQFWLPLHQKWRFSQKSNIWGQFQGSQTRRNWLMSRGQGGSTRKGYSWWSEEYSANDNADGMRYSKLRQYKDVFGIVKSTVQMTIMAEQRFVFSAIKSVICYHVQKKYMSLHRQIEPLSPAWQAVILATLIIVDITQYIDVQHTDLKSFLYLSHQCTFT
jgi:hypothetical protein